MELKVGENFIVNYGKKYYSSMLENSNIVVKKIFFRHTDITDDSITEFYKSFGQNFTILTDEEGEILRCANSDVTLSKSTTNDYDIEIIIDRVKIR